MKMLSVHTSVLSLSDWKVLMREIAVAWWCDFATRPKKRLKSWLQGKGVRVSIRWKNSTAAAAVAVVLTARMEFKRRVRLAASEMGGDGEVEKGCE